MRNSIALACLFSSLFVNAAVAQCPSTNCCGNLPVRSCCPSTAKPSCAVRPAQLSQCQISAAGSLVQRGRSARQSRAVVAQVQALPQSTTHLSQGNCNCSRAGGMQTFSSQANASMSSILQQRRNPFSLAGHAREVRPPDFCAAEFFACCESGGKDCLLNYYKCAEVTGEPLQYSECPAAARAKAQAK